MNTPKTAMGELIEWINSNASNWESETDCKSILSMATELLEKEREQMRQSTQSDAVEALIKENESMLEMAKLHMDERACMVLRNRIEKLKQSK